MLWWLHLLLRPWMRNWMSAISLYRFTSQEFKDYVGSGSSQCSVAMYISYLHSNLCQFWHFSTKDQRIWIPELFFFCLFVLVPLFSAVCTDFSEPSRQPRCNVWHYVDILTLQRHTSGLNLNSCLFSTISCRCTAASYYSVHKSEITFL